MLLCFALFFVYINHFSIIIYKNYKDPNNFFSIKYNYFFNNFDFRILHTSKIVCYRVISCHNCLGQTVKLYIVDYTKTDFLLRRAGNVFESARSPVDRWDDKWQWSGEQDGPGIPPMLVQGSYV